MGQRLSRTTDGTRADEADSNCAYEAVFKLPAGEFFGRNLTLRPGLKAVKDNKVVPWRDLPLWWQTQEDPRTLDSPPQPPLFPVYREINRKIRITKADITTLQVDAIVNAANKTLLGGGGVDGAIHAAAGRGLYEECASLQGCAVGQAKITSGYGLPARHVIHTVGPRGEKEPDLQKCYSACLDLCLRNNLRTIAFPCISTGVYGYPEEPAAKVALQTVRLWLERHWREIDCVVFCTFMDSPWATYRKLMPRYFPREAYNTGEKLNQHGLGPLVDTRSVASPQAR